MERNLRKRAALIFERLKAIYEIKGSALDWTNPWELLVATVLAAQCTDARVNLVTPELFRRWPGPAELAEATQDEVEELVRPTGFYRNKAKNLRQSARMVVEEHDATVPRTMPELLRLPGVARKTANIILSNAYGIHEGIAVDTHVKRLSWRMGLTRSENPDQIEKDLMPLFARATWGDVNHVLIYHGRAVCDARKPNCGECVLDDICPKIATGKDQELGRTGVKPVRRRKA